MNNNRSDLLDLESPQEWKKRKAKEKIERRAEIETLEEERVKRVTEKGVCEGCGKDEYIRWVRDKEFYTCYNCFVYGLGCEADIMVPMRRVIDMPEYMHEFVWDEKCLEEND